MIQFRIIALTALALLSVVPMAKPTPPALNIQFFSQPIGFAFTQTICGNTGITVDLWNFTENLSGRDPGSTWIHFKFPSVNPGWVFRSSQLTSQVINETFCPSAGVNLTIDAWNLALAFAQQGTWRVASSGQYTVGSQDSLIFHPLPFAANETWTVTTIS